MIGLIPKLLLNLVEETAGNKVRQQILLESNLPIDKYYRLNEVYDDNEWKVLFENACKLLSLSNQDAYKVYAEYFMKDAMNRFPKWFEMSSDAKSLLKKQIVIHNCFASGLRNESERAAVQDKFRHEESYKQLTTFYSSPNKLCGLYIELVKVVLDIYQEQAQVDHLTCTLTGDDICTINIIWV